MPSSSTTPSTSLSSAGSSASVSARLRRRGRHGRARRPARRRRGRRLVASSRPPRARRCGRRRRPRRLRARRRLGRRRAPPASPRLGRGRRVVAGLAGEDRVDQVGLAQAAEAVDAELVGEQVQVGERALLQRGAVQDGGHGGLLRYGSVGARPRWRQRPATVRQPSERRRPVRVALGRQALDRRRASRSPRSTARTARKSAARGDVVHAQDRARPRRTPTRARRASPRRARAAPRPVIAPRKSLRETASSSGPPERRAARRAAAAPRPSAPASWRSPAPGRARSAPAATPARQRDRHPLAQEADDVGHDVVVGVRVEQRPLRRHARVHEHERRAGRARTPRPAARRAARRRR